LSLQGFNVLVGFLLRLFELFHDIG
jgi:hypothetical protein